MSEEARMTLEVCDYTPDNRSFSLDDMSSVDESPEGTRLCLETTNDIISPFIGQRFATHDEAYDFYSEFSKHSGFSIRRHRTEGRDGVGKGLTRRYFVCHRAGHTPVKVLSDSKSQRNRRSSRCGCQAYMRISKTMELGIPEWRVTGFANIHNHELLEPNQVRFLPAYRTISESDKNRIMMFAKTGISVQQMMKLLELEKCVEPGFLPFTEKDVRNLLQATKKVEQDDECGVLLKMCAILKDEDPNFRYEYTVDINNTLQNIAWSYAPSIHSYDVFGDVVVFDTTHRLTAFDMPLGIWMGIDCYGMPCFFGCVLLREENMHSFSWALKVFLNFMHGKAPQTILTDQNMCLKEAIEHEMPQTKNAFCIWLIMAKFPSWFNAVLGERYNEWKTEFQRLYSLEVAIAVHFKDQAADHQMMQQHLHNICLKTGSPMESHAATILTPYAFCKLQDELVMATHCATFQIEEGSFLVRHHEKFDGGCKVIWVPDEEILSCSCNMFEFSGILCRHALRVLSTLNCFQIPGHYLPARWRRLNSLSPRKIAQGPAPTEHAKQVQALQSVVSALVSEASKSKERLNMALEEANLLLSRIREQPASAHGTR